jgi:hypothetical protein
VWGDGTEATINYLKTAGEGLGVGRARKNRRPGGPTTLAWIKWVESREQRRRDAAHAPVAASVPSIATR